MYCSYEKPNTKRKKDEIAATRRKRRKIDRKYKNTVKESFSFLFFLSSTFLVIKY